MLSLNFRLAKAGVIPIAKSTCDGVINPALQAEPLELHIPLLSNSPINLLPSTPAKHIFTFPKSLFSKSPFIFILGILCDTSFI